MKKKKAYPSPSFIPHPSSLTTRQGLSHVSSLQQVLPDQSARRRLLLLGRRGPGGASCQRGADPDRLPAVSQPVCFPFRAGLPEFRPARHELPPELEASGRLAQEGFSGEL